MATVHLHPSVGYPTEYTENYTRKDPLDTRLTTASTNHQIRTLKNALTVPVNGPPFLVTDADVGGASAPAAVRVRDPTQFQSTEHPSVYRETVVHKDDRGKYIDPFRNLIAKPYGRRLRYDQTHPDSIYASQWSSELADPPSIYSFPTPTGLAPEIPWSRKLQWQVDGQVGNWPTEQWCEWTKAAQCPPYDSYTDQTIYSCYKVQLPAEPARTGAP